MVTAQRHHRLDQLLHRRLRDLDHSRRRRHSLVDAGPPRLVRVRRDRSTCSVDWSTCSVTDT